MNLKERGITVGDLIIVVIFIVTTVFVINKFKENEKQSYIQLIPNFIKDDSSNNVVT